IILPADAVDSLLALLAGTLSHEVTVPSTEKLDPNAFASIADLQVSSHAVTHQQQLIGRGLLLDARKAALKERISSPGFATLLDAVQARSRQQTADQMETLARLL